MSSQSQILFRRVLSRVLVKNLIYDRPAEQLLDAASELLLGTRCHAVVFTLGFTTPFGAPSTQHPPSDVAEIYNLMLNGPNQKFPGKVDVEFGG